jgi:flavorubredoxin
MGKVLFQSGSHKCIIFEDLMRGTQLKGGDIQSNQFLITHTDASEYEEGLLFDPGGSKLVQALLRKVNDHISANRIKKIVLSHQDPDAGAGVNYWLMMGNTNVKIYASALWVRFIPHFSRNDYADNIFVPIADQGMRIDHNGSQLLVLPAHFLHSPGNFQIYDPVSRILFSGDMGTSLLPEGTPFGEVTDFASHVPYMDGFHKRYLASNKACKLWAAMVRTLDIEAIVPQHGCRYFKGRAMVNNFIDWIDRLECGVDLLSSASFRVPPAARK